MSAGAWKSSVSAEMVAGASVRYGGLAVLPVGDHQLLVWSESRPEEGGRAQVMAQQPGLEAYAWSDPLLSARSRIHEYGGGEFCVWTGPDDTPYLVFVDADSQDLYLQLEPGKSAVRLTRLPGLRFGAMSPRFALHGQDNTLVVVVEDHREDGELPANYLALVHLPPAGNDVVPITDASQLTIIDKERDFYASPKFWGGDRLVWLGWDLPAMPWEEAALYGARLADGGEVGLAAASVAHLYGSADGAVFQPEVGSDGALYFVSDATGYGQLYRLRPAGVVEQITTGNIEFMRPQWALGMTSYALLSDGRALAVGYRDGHLNRYLVELDAMGSEPELIMSSDTYLDVSSIASVGTTVFYQASNASTPATLVTLDVGHIGAGSDFGDADKETANPVLGTLPRICPEPSLGGLPVVFPGDRDEDVYGVYYRPANRNHKLADGALPPAIVRVHGGPTGMAGRGFDWKTQYWTSRGYAVLDVDYSGSSGYGRAYRERLDGVWGLRDTRDCIAGAEWLVADERAQAGKISIMGGSSGGYTVLMALAMSDVFAAGSCYYGISDMAKLLAHTHKFESGYIHRLTGTTPDNWEATLAERSPINMLDEISSPVIFFQGMKDRVVPPEQSQAIYDALVARGIRSEIAMYRDEGHGFRTADTIVDTLTRNLSFLQGIHGLSDSALA